MPEQQPTTGQPTRSVLDAVIVGGGFAGVYSLYKLKSLGLRARVFEAGSGVGGTWFWNRYPGARCDVESIDYSYSFSPELQQEWTWRERFAGQREILAYINEVVDRFGLHDGYAVHGSGEMILRLVSLHCRVRVFGLFGKFLNSAGKPLRGLLRGLELCLELVLHIGVGKTVGDPGCLVGIR